MADLAQYSIDIAARMTGTETLAELDRLTATLSGAGKGAEHFDRAIQTLSGKLSAAAAANAEAQASLASGQSRYAELETALNRASKAAERAAKKNEGIVPFELAAQVASAESALDAHAMTLEGLEKEATAAARAEKQLASQLKGVQTQAAHVDKRLSLSAENVAKLQSGFSAAGGPIGRLGQALLNPVKGFTDLTQVTGRTNAALLVTAGVASSVALAVVALGAAAAGAVVGIAAMAVGLANARRDTELTRDAAEALHPELASLRGDIESIGGRTGLAAGKIRDLAGQLKDAKVKAKDMPAALRAMATAEAAIAGGGADFVKQIKGGRKAVGELAAETQAKFGGIVEKKMRGLGPLSDRLKSNLAGLFDGLDIEPVLAGLKTLVDLFDKNTTTGRAVKAVFEGIFQPLIDNAQLAAWTIEAFALGLGIGVLKAYRAAKPGLTAIAKALDIDTSGFDLEKTLAAVTDAAEEFAPVMLSVGAVIGTVVTVATALGVAVGALSFAVPAAAAAALVAGLQGMYTSSVAAWNALKALGSAIGGAIMGALQAAGAALSSFGATLAGLGMALIDGLVGGITSGAAKVASALTGAVSGAVDSAKAALGISSPSRVMAAEVAGPIIAGTEGELDRGAKRVQSSLVAMVAPPDVPALSPLGAVAAKAAPVGGAPAESDGAAQGGAGRAGAGVGVFVDLSGLRELAFNGVQDAPSGVQEFVEMLTRAIEGDAIAVGAEVPA